MRVCERGGDVTIEGRHVANALPKDGQGRPLTSWSGCRALSKVSSSRSMLTRPRRSTGATSTHRRFHRDRPCHPHLDCKGALSVASISRLQCAPLFDQRRPVLRPGRARQSIACSECQRRPHRRSDLCDFGLDRSEQDGSRPLAAPRLHWHCWRDL
jgi:hypothetical protein